MKLFGADPEELRLTARALAEKEIELAGVKKELQLLREWMASKDFAAGALRKENGELKEAAIKLKEENSRLKSAAEPADPFADYPPELRAIIDYQRMGLKEP